MKAPRTWPNSSLSSSVAGTAALLTISIGPSLRRLLLWMAWATISLPVPLGPQMSTPASLGATLRMRRKTSCMGALSPTMLYCSSSWRARLSLRRASRSKVRRLSRARAVLKAALKR